MEKFIRFPWTIYRDDPVWAPDLIADLRYRVNKKKHPFFEYGDADFFLAFRDGQVVGRIAAIENPNHNSFHPDDKTGFWGFFECIDDQETANALFDTAAEWVRARGYNNMRGPLSCDNQDEVGMIYEGLDTQRFFLMPHNPLYYMELCEKYGMTKAKNLIAFHLDLTAPIPEKVAQLAEVVRRKLLSKGFTIRNLNKKNLRHDLRIIMDIYQTAWKDNWGFAPMSERHFNELGENMKLISVEEMVIIIEGPNEEPVGMAVALYDWMECTRWARKFPFALQQTMQIMNMVWRLFFKPKPKFTRGRLLMAGVMPEYRGLGIDSLLYVFPFEAGKKLKLTDAELSWELEDNIAIISPIEKMGGNVYKKMRIWDKSI
jgi:GNAT superfamily N-acetyltransferase